MSSVIRDYKLFAEKTGMIFDNELLLKLSLVPCAALGIFHREQVKELVTICTKNPTYHIVSQLNPNVLINRLSHSAVLFFLADGDSDKNLVYDLSNEVDQSEIPIFRAA